MPETKTLSTRWMVASDYDSVMQIERASFDHPWSLDVFLKLQRASSRSCIGMVAQYRSQIVGFVMYELLKSRIEILNFAVNPDYRRLNIGSLIVEKLKNKTIQQKRSELFLSLRETNLGAQLFFQKCGFLAEAVIEDYYQDTGEAAYVFRNRLERTGKEFAPGLSPTNRISKIMESG